MLVGKLICEGCEKDCTGGLYAVIIGTRGSINGKQQKQLEEFRTRFGKSQMVWCWDCTAKVFGAKTLIEQKEKNNTPDIPEAFKEPLNSKENK